MIFFRPEPSPAKWLGIPLGDIYIKKDAGLCNFFWTEFIDGMLASEVEQEKVTLTRLSGGVNVGRSPRVKNGKEPIGPPSAIGRDRIFPSTLQRSSRSSPPKRGALPIPPPPLRQLSTADLEVSLEPTAAGSNKPRTSSPDASARSPAPGLLLRGREDPATLLPPQIVVVVVVRRTSEPKFQQRRTHGGGRGGGRRNQELAPQGAQGERRGPGPDPRGGVLQGPADERRSGQPAAQVRGRLEIRAGFLPVGAVAGRRLLAHAVRLQPDGRPAREDEADRPDVGSAV